MTSVNTTGGKVDVNDLGRTLIHEHVLIGFPGWWMDSRQPKFQRDEVMPRIVDAFQKVRAYGVKTIVDPCPMDLGRDADFCAEVAQKSGVNLVCTTGVYDEKMGIPYTFRSLDVNEIADIYQKEIEDGIGHTGIKAGAIKIATGEGEVSEYERKALTAAAKASKATGVPLISHTEGCTCGQDQIDIITAGGQKSHCLLVGHSDGRDDPDYQEAIAKRGAYVGFDRFGLEMIVPDTIRMKNLKNLVDKGYKDRVLVSHDSVACFLGGIPGRGDAETFQKMLPNWHLTHLFENILPQLKDMGLSEADFDHIVTANPRRFFAEAVAG